MARYILRGVVGTGPANSAESAEDNDGREGLLEAVAMQVSGRQQTAVRRGVAQPASVLRQCQRSLQRT